MKEIWERLLKISPLSADDDFFENGGDSLLAMEMLAELEWLTGRTVSDSILFDAPTIGQLAQKLSDSGSQLKAEISHSTEFERKSNAVVLLSRRIQRGADIPH